LHKTLNHCVRKRLDIGGGGDDGEGEGGEVEGGEGEGEGGEGEDGEGEGGEGEGLSSASLLLSSLRLALLARSRLLFPEVGTWVGTSVLLTVGLNQRHTSSVTPSVSSTNLAGTPSRLQHSHAKY